MTASNPAGALSEISAASPAPGETHTAEPWNRPDQPDLPLSESTAPLPISQDPSQRHLWAPSGPPAEVEKPPSRPIEPAREKPLSKHATHLFSVSYLIFFAIFGTLARLGLQALTFYPGAPVTTGVLWANVGGSLLMGFFLEDRNIFREEWGHDHGHTCTQDEDVTEHEKAKNHKSVKKTIPLYIGLSTGFCGSFTSFSTFIRDVFLALSNDLPSPSGPSSAPNGGYSFMALVAVILLTVSLSLSALIFGAHLALALHPLTPTIPFKFTRSLLDPLFTFLAWGCWLGAVFLSIWPPDRMSQSPEVWRGRAVFAIIFAPLGCLLRFYLAIYLNARLPSFPLGTFVANILGTIILGMCFDLQHVAWIGAESRTSCQVLVGVMDGFCGSTTTVSTWVAELNGLARRRDAYFYGLASVAVGLGFLVVIIGSLRWTVGLASPVCS